MGAETRRLIEGGAASTSFLYAIAKPLPFNTNPFPIVQNWYDRA
jgi:hypothetical protein